MASLRKCLFPFYCYVYYFFIFLALDVEGIFRRSAQANKVTEAAGKYNLGTIIFCCHKIDACAFQVHFKGKVVPSVCSVFLFSIFKMGKKFLKK